MQNSDEWVLCYLHYIRVDIKCKISTAVCVQAGRWEGGSMEEGLGRARKSKWLFLRAKVSVLQCTTNKRQSLEGIRPSNPVKIRKKR